MVKAPFVDAKKWQGVGLPTAAAAAPDQRHGTDWTRRLSSLLL